MKKFKVRLTILLIAVSAVAKAQSFSDGIKAMDYENYGTARSIFKKLVAQQPSDGKNYYYLGQAYDYLGKKDSARLAYSAGTQADPKTIENFIGMGRTYLDENNTQKAAEFFDKAKSLTSSKDINYYVLLADAYINSDHPNKQEAINQLNKAITYNDKSADVYWQLGQAYESMNRGGEAVSAYEHYCDLNTTPSSAKGYTRIGVIWRLARNYNQSLSSFQKALQLDPNFPPAYRELAELYYNTAQYDKAKSTFQEYLNRADKDDNTQYRYAQFLFLSKDYPGAIKLLDDLRPKLDLPVMYRLSGYSNYELGNYPTGLEQMETFFKKEDTAKILPSDYEYYGKLLSKSGNDSMAVIYLQKAIDLDSTKYSLYNDEGTILLQDKKYHDAALAYLNKIKAAKKDATIQDYFNEGKSFYLGKEFPQADSAYSGMILMNKSWPIGYIWRARVQTNLDNPDSAKGLAAPFYHMTIAKIMASQDTTKYNKELQESYNYLAQLNAVKDNFGASLYYYDLYLKYNPSDADAAKNEEIIKKQIKNPSLSSMPMGKIGDTSTVTVNINGNNFEFMYDPIAPTLVVNNNGYTKIFGAAPQTGSMMKLISAKIGDHTAKTILVVVDPNQTRDMVIGGWALNQFNIVPDYKTNSLLLR